MTSRAVPSTIRVMSVDDNPHVAAALRAKFSRTPGFEWVGSMETATGLVDWVKQVGVDVVLLDLDLPVGGSPFDALRELQESCSEVRAVIFSGHVRKDLIDRVIELGAWGYASKNDGEDALIEVIRKVIAGEFAMSSDVQATWDV